jgi:hypothetical protein
MTIKQQYKKARANYLARVNYLKKQGWDIKVIAPVKKPTKASIERLNKQTSKQLRSKAKLYDINTGQEITKHRLSKAKEQGKRYKNIVSKQIAKKTQRNSINQVTSPKVISKINIEELKKQTPTNVKVSEWYEDINSIFAQSIRRVLFELTTELTKTDELEQAFSKVLQNNPDLFPQNAYEPDNILKQRFYKISKKMREYISDKKKIDNITNALDRTDKELSEIVEGFEYERYGH